MKIFILVACCCCVFLSFAHAGEIYGTIKDNGKPVQKDVKLEVVANQKTYSAVTDNYGSFRIFLPVKGKYTLTVQYKQQSLALEIVSYEKSTRYDLLIENKAGKYSIRRK
jgi:carboxypeptidase family protein